MKASEVEIDELSRRRKAELEMLTTKDSVEISDVFYLINCNWISEWKSFIFNKSSLNEEQISPNEKIGTLPPGPISNNELFSTPEDPRELIQGLKKAVNYRGVNEQVWFTYFKIYGGGPVIARRTLNLYDEALEVPERLLDRSTI